MGKGKNNRDETIEERLDQEDAGCDDSLTYAIIGAAQKVHRALGPGFTESTYQNALAKELILRKMAFDSQRDFSVVYEGMICGTYRPDTVVAGEVIVESKATADLVKEHHAQTISYLRASGLPTALLLNFGSPSLQVRRFRY